MQTEYLLALGGNLDSNDGPPIQTLARAVAALAGSGSQLRGVSRFFRTPCFPAGAGPDYVNAAVSVVSSLAPQDMLALAHQIEADAGRERQQRWGMRTLDIDLIAAGDLVLPDPEMHRHWRLLPSQEQALAAPDRLILPHPRLQDRAFVLVPLNDIAPRWVHPVLGQSVAEMLDKLEETDRIAVVPL